MNQKMNYMINSESIIDLEYNIPTRQANVRQRVDTKELDYSLQLRSIKDFYNQRKIHIDTQRFLGVENPSVLYLPLSRADIYLWRNIQQYREQDKLIKLCDIRHINLVFEGSSMFHHYAD